jgi:hypothetical protein
METEEKVKTTYIDITQLPVADERQLINNIVAHDTLTIEKLQNVWKELISDNEREYLLTGNWDTGECSVAKVEYVTPSGEHIDITNEFVELPLGNYNMTESQYKLMQETYARNSFYLGGLVGYCTPSRNSMLTYRFNIYE